MSESLSLDGIKISVYKDTMGFDYYKIEYKGKVKLLSKYSRLEFLYEEIKKILSDNNEA